MGQDQTNSEQRSSLRRLLPDLAGLRESEATRLILIGVLVGALAGLTAAGFDRALVLLGRLILGTAEPGLHPPNPLRRVLAPGLAGLLAGAILHYLTREHRARSTADIVVAVQPEGKPVSLREGLMSALGTVVAVAAGHSGGRESPIVQLSGAVASRACRLLRVRPDHARTLVAAGAGAGIAASFNTPLGGAFFALEIILGGFATEAFAPVVAATVVSTMVGQALLGPRIAFRLPAFRFEHASELLPYAILGVLSALLAALFKRTVDLLRDRVGALGLHPVLRTGLAGFGVGLVSLGSSAVMGNGYPWIESVITGRLRVTVLAIFLALALKFLATALTVAGRCGAGLFSASLFMGAMTGIFVGGATKALFPSLIGDPGAFGMVGMGAFAAAVLHAPVTLSLMLFEMTGNYEIIPPLIFANGIAALVNIGLRSESMINLELKRRGLMTGRARRDTVLERVSVSDIARASDLETAAPETPIHELVARFLARPIDVVYLVDARGRYAGMVDLQDIKPHLASPSGPGPASAIARHSPPPLQETAPARDALRAFFRYSVDELPVVDGRGLFVGVLSERDVVAAWQSATIREGELLAGFTSGPVEARHTDFVELPHGQALGVVDVGPQRAGQSLRELQLPQRHGITVVALSLYDRARGRWRRVAPDASLALAAEDRLVVVGPRAQIRALRGEEPGPASLIPEDDPITR